MWLQNNIDYIELSCLISCLDGAIFQMRYTNTDILQELKKILFLSYTINNKTDTKFTSKLFTSTETKTGKEVGTETSKKVGNISETNQNDTKTDRENDGKNSTNALHKLFDSMRILSTAKITRNFF